MSVLVSSISWGNYVAQSAKSLTVANYLFAVW